jgi:[ribosomal protein S5]-alanine N-acetyltransferase
MNETFIELSTKRLRIICLEVKDMLLLKEDGNEDLFEKRMGYSINRNDELSKDLNSEFSRLALENKSTRLWYRTWDLISVEDNKRIGGALFKGGPNGNGEVEIGYGIDEDYQRKGYGTEGISAIVHWALHQTDVLSVIAETEKDNIPSQKLLKNIGMVRYSETESYYYWKCVRDNKSLL